MVRRPWLWLGLVLTAALIALGAYVLTRGPSARSEVASYVEAVDAAEARLAPRLGRVDSAYGAFRLDAGTLARGRSSLVAAERSIRQARAEIATQPAPARVTELRRRILHAFDLEIALAHDLVRVSQALPRLAAVNAPVTPAAKKLSQELKAATKAKQQQAALATYTALLRRVAVEVAALDAPPLLAPTAAAEAARLRARAGVLDRLGRAAAQGNKPEVDQLERYLARVATQTEVTRAEHDAVARYNRRVAAIAAANAAVTAELHRLNGSLP